MYNVEEKGLNEARLQLFQKGKFSEEFLPPNKDAFLQHLKRCNHQASIWKQSLNNNIVVPSPTSCGWKHTEEDGLGIDWLQSTEPITNIRPLIGCSCKKSGCSGNLCKCRKNNLHCSTLCKCCNCTNKNAEEESQLGYESQDSEDSDEEIDFSVGF